MYVYVGASVGADRPGISVYRLDAGSGALTALQTLASLFSPSFLALHPSGRYLYAAERQLAPDVKEEGAIAAFAVDPASGRLTLLNRVRSRGESPCYVSVSPDGRYVFAAHFTGGQVAAYPVEPDGRAGEASSVVQHEGIGPDPRRQDRPHPHSIGTDPAGRYVLSCDRGTDKIMVYRLDTERGWLVPNDVPYGQVGSGAGPRHFAFHPNGRLVYVINEIDSTLSAFTYDASRGTLRMVQTISTLPDDYQGDNTTAQVIVHPSGRFVYGSNRGHDSIAIFAIDQGTGRMRLVGHEPTQGRTPRNFNVDPTGAYLLAANQGTNTIVSFRIDQATGRLAPAGHVTETPSPTCIVFRL